MENKISIHIKSDKEKYYEISICGKSFLDMSITNLIEENEKNKNKAKKYFKNIVLSLETLKSSNNFTKDEEFQKLEDFSKIINLINNNNNILELKENCFNLDLSINLPDPFSSSIKINFELLNIAYYLTQGPRYKRINDHPFFTSMNSKFFNLEIIKELLEKEKISNRYSINNYRYYDQNKNGFIKINEYKNYQTPKSILILEFHYNHIIEPISYKLKNKEKNITDKIRQIKNQINTMNAYSQKAKRYDLIYLYASPLVKLKGKEMDKPINYRIEIKNIINSLNNSKKYYNCLFECANENILNDLLMKNHTKILHIASHGDLEEETGKYYLILEDKGIQQNVKLEKLEKILKKNESKLKNIDLVFVSTCHSESLGKTFLKYGVKNVIYIQGKTPISNIAALKFTEYFYKELIKGNNIKESFYKAQEKIKIDRTLLFYNPNDCCCSHKHKKDCKIRNNNTERKIVHREYHQKICECNFDEFNTHKNNCKLVQKIKENNNKYNFYMKDLKNNCVKICCCDEDIKHNEYSKFIFESNDDVAPFKFQEKGNLNFNKNSCIFDFDDNKNFSVIGRRKEMKEIYDILSNNDASNNNPIIIYGDKEIGKQDFSESICVYLFERKIIDNYKIIEIKTELDLDYFKIKLSKYNKNNKIIIIIKINYTLEEKKALDLLNFILNEIKVESNNFYYIILLSCQNEKIEENITGKFKKIIHLEKLREDSAKDLLFNLCDSLGYLNNLNSINKGDNLKQLFEMINYQPKKINDIAECISRGAGYEELIIFIKSKINEEKIGKNKFEQIMEKSVSKIYYLLSIMKEGLPNSIIKLIFRDYEEVLEEEDRNNTLIYQDEEDNWYHIIQKYKKDIDNYFIIKKKFKEECISNCLKVFARILFCYIEKNKQNICFPDGDIHYIFNSYNGNGIWKSFDDSIYQYCFLYEIETEIDKEEYNNILKNDFNLERYKNNIINLLENNLEYIKILLNNNDSVFNEYLEQILIMLPSSFFLQKDCKIIINECIKISEELNLENSTKRLLLFLYSIEENPEINPEEFINTENEFQGEAYFLKGLKKNHIQSFEKARDNYYDLISKDKKRIDIKKKISYVYYEISILSYQGGNYEKAKIYLNKAKNISNEIGNYFFIDRCNIDLSLIMKKLSQGYFESVNLLKNIVNRKVKINDIYKQKLESYLVNEAYDLLMDLKINLEPDIIMLNSNPLMNYCSALHSGIFAYMNNQYYILTNLYEKIKSNIKIKSIVLNKENLVKAFDNEGKILIIQSDDFTENGELILESDIGESQLLPIEELSKMIPIKIKYKIVILCFINSSKLRKIFEDKAEYLVTFDNINLLDFDYNSLFKYNELSIEFIINFIEKLTQKNVINSFNESHQLFIKGFENNEKITQKNYIIMTKKSDLNKPIFEINKFSYIKNEKIGLFYPLLNIPDTPRIKEYDYEIKDIIEKIVSEKQTIINVFLNDDNRIGLINTKKITKKEKIGIELIKFFYRHQNFSEIYYIHNPNKYGRSLEAITNKIFEKLNEEEITRSKDSNPIFILINNFEKIKSIKYNIEPLELIDNVQYLILSNNEIIINKDEHTNEKETKNDKKYKNKIIINNSKLEIVQKNLESLKPKNSKINESNKRKINNINLESDNLFDDLNLICNYPFNSEENFSNKGEAYDI